MDGDPRRRRPAHQVASTRAGATQPVQYDGYDAAGRLTSWCVTPSGSSGCTGTALTTYTYDPVGNRTKLVSAGATTTTYTYDSADELTTSTTGSTTKTLTYDAAGDNTGDGTTTTVYDANRHPLSATTGSTALTFTNDDQGNRVTTKTNGALTSTNTWDTNDILVQLATTTNATGALVGDYHTDPLGLPASEHTTAGAFYDAHDPLGSITDVTSATGTDQIRYSYDPYGTQSTTTISGITAPTTPFGFTGQLNDPALTGTQDLRARTYTPTTGRFTTTDPIALRPDTPYTSTYAYTDDAPTYRTDPTGTCWWIPWSGDAGCTSGLGLAGSLAAPGSVLGVLDSMYNTCKQGMQFGQSNYDNSNGTAGAEGCLGQFTGLNETIQGFKDTIHGCPSGQQELGLGLFQLGTLFAPGLDGFAGSLDAAGSGELGLRTVAGSVTRNALNADEYIQALEIVNDHGGYFEGQLVSNQAGIDGTYDGIPASLKEVQPGSKNNIRALANAVTKASDSAAKANLTGVWLFIKAVGVTRAEVLTSNRIPQIIQQGIITRVLVEAADGWVEFP